jgi:hypothetical protein
MRASPLAPLPLVVVLTALLAGCAAGDSDGALSQATFGAGCAAGGACVGGLDAPLAVGSRLPLRVDLQIPGTATPPLELRSAADDVFSVEDNVATAHAAGVAALLLHGPEDLVLDFLHLWVAVPEGLGLTRRSEEGAVLGTLTPQVALYPGDELLVSVEAVAGGQDLLGEFPVSVTGGGDTVAVVGAGVSRWFRIRALAPGQATLVAEALGHRTEVQVEVLP